MATMPTDREAARLPRPAKSVTQILKPTSIENGSQKGYHRSISTFEEAIRTLRIGTSSRFPFVALKATILCPHTSNSRLVVHLGEAMLRFPNSLS